MLSVYGQYSTYYTIHAICFRFVRALHFNFLDASPPPKSCHRIRGWGVSARERVRD